LERVKRKQRNEKTPDKSILENNVFNNTQEVNFLEGNHCNLKDGVLEMEMKDEEDIEILMKEKVYNSESVNLILEVFEEEEAANIDAGDDLEIEIKTEEALRNLTKEKDIIEFEGKEPEKNSGTFHHACLFCEFKTKSYLNLQKHKWAEHDCKDMHYQCNRCSFVGKSISLLKAHIRKIHKKNKKGIYPCGLCNLSSKLWRDLGDHKLSVHGVKISHACTLCSFEGNGKKSVKIHMDAVHKRLKIICEYCSAPFTQSGNLYKHIKNVHEKIQHKCHLCEFKCIRSDVLKGHVDSEHNGIVHNCDQCPFSSKTKSNLSAHIKMKHKELVFTCDHCNYSTVSEDVLYVHCM